MEYSICICQGDAEVLKVIYYWNVHMEYSQNYAK